ncbi:MAG TPA: PQQ-dependent sugar dehydrogenase [Geminicoccaceae bacterium]
MRIRICGMVLGLLLLTGAPAAGGARDAATIRTIADGFDYLSNVAWPGGGDDTLFVLEQHRGMVWALDEGQPTRRTYLDIGDRLIENPNSEEGLLGLAFPIGYPAVPQVYVSYINAAGELQVSRFDAVEGGRRADRSSETPLLRFERHARMHHCGHIVVNPRDGDLYLCLGDTEDNRRRHPGAPDAIEHEGAILRLALPAPEASPVPTRPAQKVSSWQPIEASMAAVPRTFAGGLAVEAHGLRNPWHFAIDPESGTMFLPDVGRDHWEEINLQPGHAPPRHHGWPFAEGNECLQACGEASFSWPVHVYRHDGLRCAIIGGEVYQGAAAPAWRGVFVFGDHCSGEVWALRVDHGSSRIRRLATTDMMITAIGSGPGGEIVIAGGPAGTVRRLSFPDGDPDAGWTETAPLAGEAALVAQRQGFGRLYENQQAILNSRRWRWASEAAGWYHQVRRFFH